jgi:hypothetical protein
MISSLAQVCYASLPVTALAALADLRCLPDVRVALLGDRAWVRWEPGNDQVLIRLLPVRDVKLFVYRDEYWYQHGHHLPSFNLPPDTGGQPLHHVLVPAPVEPLAAPKLWIQRVNVRLVRDEFPHQTSAVLCQLQRLSEWADTVTTAHLTSIRAARCQDSILMLGRRLPLLPGAERFWGGRVLMPLGHRLEPALPERDLLGLWSLQEKEFVLVRTDKVEILDQESFEPLTRPGIRLALQEIAPHG